MFHLRPVAAAGRHLEHLAAQPPRYLVATIIAAWLTVVASGAADASDDKRPSGEQPPNIVLILADDLGAECLGCYGGTSYRTPRLDRMAAEGMRFHRAYANPICSPTRAELLTGRYPCRTGITGVTHLAPPPSRKLDVSKHRTLANFLKEAGYATCIAGKWHLCNDFADHPSHVADAGFQHRFLWRLLRDGKVVRHYWNPELWFKGRPADERGRGKFGDDLFTQFVIDFIERHRDRPFLAYYPMTLVHSQTATGSNFPASPDTIRPGADPDVSAGSKQQGFAGLVAYTDKLVGRILDAIDRMGLAEETLVVFIGDNGTDRVITSRLGEEIIPGGKTRLNDGGTRVPLLVRWTGKVKPGTVADELVDASDMFPTLLDAARVAPPEGYAIDGRSFYRRLLGEPFTPRAWIYAQSRNRWCVRGDRYRLNGQGDRFDAAVLWKLGDSPYEAERAGDSPEAQEAHRQLIEAARGVRQ
jgi:arylsulfatase A